jgi:hypothetical protein
MGRGTRVGRCGGRRLLGEVGREALVEALDRDGGRGAQRLHEPLRLARLLAALSPHGQWETDDDAFRILGSNHLEQLGQACLRSDVFDDPHGTRQRTGRVGDGDPGTRRAEVERQDLHRLRQRSDDSVPAGLERFAQPPRILAARFGEPRTPAAAPTDDRR